MDLLTYLKEYPPARERANKNKVISKFIWDKYGKKSSSGQEFTITTFTFTDIVGEVLSLDRKWRLILKNNPELRGKYYLDKYHLEVDKQRELGYNI